MARRRRLSEDEVRQTLLEMARLLFGPGPGDLAVFAVRGDVEIVQPGATPTAPPGPAPEGMSDYDAAILTALTDWPASAQRLAARAGHRHNSYFRGRLAVLVEAGRIRHTRRGYSRHDG